MSLYRFIYYSAVIGGWAALVAWLILEAPIRYLDSLGQTGRAMLFWNLVAATLTAGLVGGSIAAGLNVVSGMTNPQWKRHRRRILAGLIAGGAGGAVGGLVGSLLYSALGFARAIGWMIMGLAIGAADGVYEGSRSKIRNGLIGGAIGGFVGGGLFDLIARPGADMSSRAMAFVILGISIGALIGLAQVVFKEAWLTVVDGFRPGRQLILSQPATVLGRGDHLPLPFLGYPGRDLESEHVKITRESDGQYVVEDNGSRIGTTVNGEPLQGPMILADGDLIKLGSNIVRFEHRERVSDPTRAPDAAEQIRAPAPIPAPPRLPASPPLPAPPGMAPPGTSEPGGGAPGPGGPPPLPGRKAAPNSPPRIPPPPPPPG